MDLGGGTLVNTPHTPFIAVLTSDYCVRVSGDSQLPERQAVSSLLCVLSLLPGAPGKRLLTK